MRLKPLIMLAIVSFVFGCSYLPTKTFIKSKKGKGMLLDSELSVYANDYFWDHFHKGNYEKLDSIFYYLQAAYVENPNDLKTVTHLAFANAWAISESGKLASPPPDIINHATLATKYFGESYQLNPNDPRVLGFLGDFKIIQGEIAGDEKMQKEGYFDGRKSIRQWREFNYFTLGYVLSQLPYETWQFKKALEWQWKTLDDCYCEKFDRGNPSFKRLIAKEATETDLKRKRACWNNWIAPHNLEGFFLNLGDMLVKSGDYQTGIKIYQMIKEIPTYETWSFKDFLDDRIANAEQNVARFRQNVARAATNIDQKVVLVNTSIACMSCHQMSPADELKFKDINLDKYFDSRNIYWLKGK